MGWHRPYKERKYAVGQRLMTLRTRTKLTQTELAALVGVNRRSLQNWESGAGYPKENGLQRLIAVFLAQGVFTPGQEREEAAQLWELVSQDAPRPLTPFDAAWFTSLLAARPVPVAAATAPVASTDALPFALPTGLVTFLATDIEGSTQRWERAPQAMQQALTRHHAILRQLTALYHGQVLHTAGDSFICVYGDAPAALQSALAIQRALLAEPWPETVAPLRVRMALHSGAATDAPEGYVAEPTLNRLSRVLAASQGGQILLTQAAVDLIGAGWPEGVTRRDLGVRQLRDVTIPLQLWQALAPDLPVDVPSLHPVPTAPTQAEFPLEQVELAGLARLVDWGEAIDAPALYGRDHELAALAQWVLDDHCRVVALLGMGGIGKTSLAITFAHQVAERFDVVVFRSLRNAPLPSDLLDGFIRGVSAQPGIPPEGEADKIAYLIQLLRARRCLLVLDNCETIMVEGAADQMYRDGYASYGMLIQRLAESAHESCLILTSREKPAELGPLEGRTARVRTLTLTGVAESVCQTILSDKALAGDSADWTALAQRCGGNPLALKLVAEPIRELFGGDVAAFLLTGETFFDGVGKLLEQQIRRASPLERALLIWLAIEREPAMLDRLVGNFAAPRRRSELLTALEALRRRSLIERSGRGASFTLQPVVMEYLTTQLIDDVSRGIARGALELLTQYALVQATNRDYVRRSQERLIAMPILKRLVSASQSLAVAERWLIDLLNNWRRQPLIEQGYGPGNVVNLQRLLHGHLRGVDLSELHVRQAYLQGVEAQDASLARAHVSESVFGDAFDYSVCVTLSADNAELVAGTSNGEVRLWRVADRVPLLALQAHTAGVYGVAVATAARLIASGSADGTIKLWAMDSGECLAVLEGHTDGVWSVALAADGRLVASSSTDGTVRLWAADSATCLAVLEGHAGMVWDVALSADGRLVASGGGDGTVRLWAAESGTCLAVLEGHVGAVHRVALTADGHTVASSSADGTVRLWSVDSRSCQAVLEGHTGAVFRVALTADGRMVASGAVDGMVRVWSAESGQLLDILQGHTGEIWGLAFAADGQLAASSSADGTIRLWDVASAECLAILQGRTSMVRGVALSSDGQLAASCAGDATIQLWETERGTLRSLLRGHTGIVNTVAMTPDGRRLVSGGSDGTVRLWDVASGVCLTVLHGHTGDVWGVAMSADGRLIASGGADRVIRVWDVTSGVYLAVLRGHTGDVWGVAISAGGHLIASGAGDNMVRLWEVESGRALTVLEGHRGVVRDVAVTADGRILASGSFDRTIRLWDVDNGTCLAVLEGHTGTIWGVALAADGRLVASGGSDGTLRLWDTASGLCLGVMQGHTGLVRDVALAADGRLVASGGSDGTLRLWDTTSRSGLGTLRPDRPYERMDITGLDGVTDAQKAALRALGAVERSLSHNAA